MARNPNLLGNAHELVLGLGPRKENLRKEKLSKKEERKEKLSKKEERKKKKVKDRN